MKKKAKLREHFRAYHDPKNSGEQRALALQEAQQLLKEAELSHDEKRERLRQALRKSIPELPDVYIYRYIVAVYDAFLIYEENEYSGGGSTEKLFKSEYSIDGSGNVSFAAPAEVRIEYVPVEADLNEANRLTESFIELKERAIADDGTMLIKVIEEGWGSSGYYPREVIERDLAAVFPKGTHMMANHQTAAQEAEQPEGRIEDLAAEFVEDPTFLENGPDGPGAYVRVKPFGDYSPMLEDKAEAIGVSINGGGTFHIGEAEGKTGRIIDSLTVGKSVDFVTRAGAGGAIISLQEAKRNQVTKRQNALCESASGENATQENPHIDPNYRATLESEAANKTQGVPTVNEQDAQKLRESNTRLETRLIERDARDLAKETLSGLDMPEPTKNRLIESLSKSPVTKTEGDDRVLDAEAFKAKVTEAAQHEMTFAQEAYGYGKAPVQGCGNGDAPTEEKLKEAQTAVANARAINGLR